MLSFNKPLCLWLCVDHGFMGPCWYNQLNRSHTLVQLSLVWCLLMCGRCGVWSRVEKSETQGLKFPPTQPESVPDFYQAVWKQWRWWCVVPWTRLPPHSPDWTLTISVSQLAAWKRSQFSLCVYGGAAAPLLWLTVQPGLKVDLCLVWA